MIIYGKQLFLYVLEKYPGKIKKILLAKECDKKLFSQIARLNKPIEKLDFKKAQALARGGNHQGFLCEIEDKELKAFEEIKDKDFLLMLYGLSDVGNIGAIARTAYAFGVDALVVSGVKSLNLEGILRSSSGAALNLDISLVPDGLSAINELKQKGFHIYASSMDGVSVNEIKIKEKKVLVMGSEGFGIPKKVLSKCDEVVKIQMVRDFDSLNVNAACAILVDRMINE